jgi:hypothetical protein
MISCRTAFALPTGSSLAVKRHIKVVDGTSARVRVGRVLAKSTVFGAIGDALEALVLDYKMRS